jgi:hypothetical protein
MIVRNAEDMNEPYHRLLVSYDLDKVEYINTSSILKYSSSTLEEISKSKASTGHTLLLAPHKFILHLELAICIDTTPGGMYNPYSHLLCLSLFDLKVLHKREYKWTVCI